MTPLTDIHPAMYAMSFPCWKNIPMDRPFPQPPPADHPWRDMPWQGMTPHTSGTTLSAQTRYADGVREILECFFDGRPQRNEYQIVTDGKLAGMGAHSYSEGNATGGSANTR